MVITRKFWFPCALPLAFSAFADDLSPATRKLSLLLRPRVSRDDFTASVGSELRSSAALGLEERRSEEVAERPPPCDTVFHL